MKKEQTSFVLLLTILALLLASCMGGAVGTTTSWPGLSVHDDTAYLAYNQFVYAIDTKSGTELWRFPDESDRNATFYATPTMTADGQLIVGGYNKVLYSLNPENGSENWTFDLATDRYVGSALATGEGIFAPNADYSLYAIDTTGKLMWSFPAEEALWAKPTADPDCTCIYLPSMDHRIYAINAEDGNLIWKTDPLGGAIVGSPSLSPEDILYTGTFNNEVIALSAENGSNVWEYSAENWVWAGPILDEEQVYASDLNGNLYALEKKTGKIIWQINLESAITEPALITPDALYVSTENGILYAVNPDSTIRWTREVSGKLNAAPVLAGEAILVAVTDGDDLIVAFDANGNQQWTFAPEE